METSWLQPGSALARALKGFLNGRPFYQRSANFLHGLQLHQGYRSQKNFSTWAGKDHGLDPHKARLLDGIELWPLAGRGLQGEYMDVLGGCGLESPMWTLGT